MIGGRERERERKADRQGDRQTDRQTEGERVRKEVGGMNRPSERGRSVWGGGGWGGGRHRQTDKNSTSCLDLENVILQGLYFRFNKHDN